MRNQIVYDEDYLSGRAKPMTAATVITLIVGFLFTAGSLYGEIRYEPDPALIRIVSLEDPLPLKELIRTALIASGTPRSEIEERTAAIEGIIASAPPSTGHVLNDGELLLEWMHAEHLSRYVVDQTRLDVLVDQGTYNCVSSAVFYLLLARAGGLPVHGVLTSDHAFCRISPKGTEGVDVETTTPFGFDPGTRMEAVDSFSGRTGFVYVPPGNYRRRRDIGERELISLIYQNRISDLQRRGEWAETIGLARDRWALSGSDAAKEDFRASLSNYVADMDRRHKYDEGLRFLRSAAGELGADHGLADIATALLGNGVSNLLRAGRIESARAMLNDEELTALVPAEYVESRMDDADRAELDMIVKSGDFEGALIAADEALESGLIEPSRWEETMLYLWSTEARRISSGGKWIDGWKLLTQAPRKMASISRWSELEDSYRHNAAVVYHNQFADFFRKSRFEEAGAVLEEALALFPEDTTLIRDLRTLESREGGG